MATTGTLCSDADVAALAKNMSADIDNGDTAETDLWIVEAEGIIMAVSRYDFVGNYASLDATAKLILRGCAASLAVIPAITYDMSGFTSRVEAEDMINIYRDRANMILGILRDIKVREWIING